MNYFSRQKKWTGGDPDPMPPRTQSRRKTSSTQNFTSLKRFWNLEGPEFVAGTALRYSRERRKHQKS